MTGSKKVVTDINGIERVKPQYPVYVAHHYWNVPKRGIETLSIRSTPLSDMFLSAVYRDSMHDLVKNLRQTEPP
jgi:hypothetical protein